METNSLNGDHHQNGTQDHDQEKPTPMMRYSNGSISNNTNNTNNANNNNNNFHQNGNNKRQELSKSHSTEHLSML